MAKCPSSDELVAFHTGDLAPVRVGDVTQHIEACNLCEERLQFLDGMTDPVLAALRRGTSAEGAKSSPPLSPAPAFPSADSNIRLEAQPESYSFLAKAELPGELGRLGHYRVLSLLGRGGMGIVFHAEDLNLRRAVALKVLAPSVGNELEPRQRFLREARATAALRNDHIVTIYDVGQQGEVPFLAMELLKGEPLDVWLSRGTRATLAETLRIGREIADGLAAAHDAGLIHRDIKPANIWLEDRSTGRGSAPTPPPRVKILDFGLAQVVADDVRLTKTGYIVGTPAYMAPEQARNETVDTRADLFSLGCVLYRLATGINAFPGETTMAVLIALAVDQPPGMRQLNPQLPQAFCRLVEWLLAKNPANRPVSARVIIDALEAIEHDTSAAAPATPAERGSHEAEAQGTQALSVPTPPRTPIPPGVTRPVRMPASVPPPPRDAGTRRRWLLAALALLFLILIVIGLMIPANLGMLRIEAGDEVAAQLERTPIRLRQLEKGTEIPLSSIKWPLPPGDYEVIPDADTGLVVDPPSFAITRGGTTVIRVTAVAKPASDPDRGLTAWIAETAKLKGATQAKAVEEKLRERNPKFDGSFEPRFEGDAIVELRFDSKAVTDLSPLRALKKLSILNAWSSDAAAPERLADLTPLAGMAITELSLKQARVMNLAPLADLPLMIKLDVENTPVTDLRPLQRCRKLESLGVGRTPIKDLVGLETLPLKLLSIERTAVSDLAPLKEMPLEHLDCSYTAVTSLAPLEGKPLGYLACYETKVTDFSPLVGMPLKNLTGPVVAKRDAPVLQKIKSLMAINNVPVDKFWAENKP